MASGMAKTHASGPVSGVAHWASKAPSRISLRPHALKPLLNTIVRKLDSCILSSGQHERIAPPAGTGGHPKKEKLFGNLLWHNSCTQANGEASPPLSPLLAIVTSLLSNEVGAPRKTSELGRGGLGRTPLTINPCLLLEKGTVSSKDWRTSSMSGHGGLEDGSKDHHHTEYSFRTWGASGATTLHTLEPMLA